MGFGGLLMYERDRRNIEILTHLSKVFGYRRSVFRLGPIKDDEESQVLRCEVLLESLADFDVPSSQRIATRSGDFGVELDLREGPPATLYACPDGFTPAPIPDTPTGPLRGGDAIWPSNTLYDDVSGTPCTWGTIAFVARHIRIRDGAIVRQFENACVSCSHILSRSESATVNEPVSTLEYPNQLSLEWWRPIKQQAHLIDVAVASFPSSIPANYREVRGLGLISGVRQPFDGVSLVKFGARTGLSRGRDLGVAQVTFDYTQRAHFIRVVSAGFSLIHDSGSAVLDADRNLVGLLVGGDGTYTYYIPAAQMHENSIDPNLVPLKIGIEL